MLPSGRHRVRCALVALLLSTPAMKTRAEEADDGAWMQALETLVGRVVQYRTLVDGRPARVLGRASSVVRTPEHELSVMGVRVVEAREPGLPDRICSEEPLDVGAYETWVLAGGAFVSFGATLKPELRQRLGIPSEPDPLPPPPPDEVAALEACARRVAESPIQRITLHLRRDPAPNPGVPSMLDFDFGFDGAEHRVEEELGERWAETALSVVMRPGFQVADLTVENSNVTVMHCSDEGGWTTLGFKTGETSWQKLRRSGTDFVAGPVRVAPFPPYSKAELAGANAQGYTDCEPTLGSRRYRIRYRGKTLKTIVVLPALGC